MTLNSFAPKVFDDSKKLYYRGTKFQIEDNTYMLCESFEKGYVFQIFSVDGYHAGCCEGFIKEEEGLEDTHRGVSKEHLINEINRNFENTTGLEIVEEE